MYWKIMQKLMWTIVFFIFLSILSFGASSIKIKDAWVREVPPASSVTAVYMVVENNGNEDDRLIEVKTDVSNHAEFHTTLVNEKGVAKMEKFEYVNIPSGKTVVLEPGESHIMLIELIKPLKAKDKIKLDIRFEKFGVIKVEAQVKGMQSHDIHEQ